jgi:uncharacterized membrane protein
MKGTVRLQVILLMVLFATVQPARSQTGSEVKTPRGPLEQVLQYLPGNHTNLGQGAARTGAKPEFATAAAAKVYVFQTADYPGAASSTAFDTNSSTIVGFFQFDPNGTPPSPMTAFTLKGNIYQILDIPGATTSAATGINTSGQIVGLYVDVSMVSHGFVDTGGTFTNVDFPSATGTDVFDITDSGVMVGAYTDTTGNLHGFIDNAGDFTTLDYPGAASTIAAGINSSGEIVGEWGDTSGDTFGFVYSGGVFTSLSFPLGHNTEAIGVNELSPRWMWPEVVAQNWRTSETRAQSLECSAMRCWNLME